MRKLQSLLKLYLKNILASFRYKENLTQEQIAHLLRISARSYSDLERGKYGVSAVTLLLFLALLPDNKILEIVHDFHALAVEAEKKEAA